MADFGQSADDLREDFSYEIRPDLGARAYDLFRRADFLNFMPWTRSIEYLLGCGVEQIEKHNQALASRLIDNVDRDRFKILSSTSGSARTSIVVMRHSAKGQTERCFEALAANGIDVSLRRGALRVSGDLYNTEKDMESLLCLLHENA